ncbi:hypothetical protein PAAG_04301 [Paracoccidioides lutzii Pb01]|uniref:Uncharacterized protein n=1 Tax=Paracoccidioides lutzii (strain ATCC MYA-826 / Pb01) TaxID=502779 RepID=C1H0K7_PARBA|nr:hypothetical protein PAAG_04301 [Paracoccidioides lutzii Pb01]EEH33248.1 hypothetical protein PAAG_04301 [Paracoccidioides lutzii Pb01]
MSLRNMAESHPVVLLSCRTFHAVPFTNAPENVLADAKNSSKVAGLNRQNWNHAARMNSIITISYSNGANPRSKKKANAKIRSQLLKQVHLSTSGIVSTIEATANQRMMKELVEVTLSKVLA